MVAETATKDLTEAEKEAEEKGLKEDVEIAQKEAQREIDLKQHDDVDMVTYRIEVGKNHGVMPKDIVGAIANEAGIDSQNIGRIKLEDDFSTVDLPDGMPKDIFQHLKNKVRVCQQPMKLSLVGESKPQSRSSEPRARSKKPSASPRRETPKK